jgi:hypothetical protein
MELCSKYEDNNLSKKFSAEDGEIREIASLSSSVTPGWNCWPSVPSSLLHALEPLKPPFFFHQ